MRQKMISLVSVVFFLLLGSEAFAQHTRVTNPNTLAVEGLGRSLSYSIVFDRVLNDDMVAGIGYGTVLTAQMVPVYMNYYLNRDKGSIYGTVGATVITNGSTLAGQSSGTAGITYPANGILPNFGLGYESRGDSGFLFRVAAYGIVATTVIPWFGFTFGYSF